MVVWSDPAKADLRAIHDYVALNSKHYARKVTQEIIDKTEPLDGLPRMGRKVAELGDESIREVPIYSYRILYEIRGETIVVLAVIHKRRDLQPESLE